MLDTEALKLIGGNIRTIREAQGVSSRELAGKIGMINSNFNKIERGKHNISVMRIIGIARALGVSLNEIFEGTY